MPCYRPLKAYLTRDRHPTGGRVISFSRHGSNYDLDKSIDLPCGRCIGCRLERSRQWAVRLMHEKQMHESACFITLTYDNDHLPSDGSLVLKHVQDFMKRLRAWYSAHGGEGRLRYFLCGEYGDINARPHYHLILFGYDFLSDRVLVSKNFQDDVLYESPTLSGLWGHGLARFGDVTFESAAYVARYCVKKVTGAQASAHYQGRKPEFATMSRRPGIGALWFERYMRDVYPSDEVIVRGKACKPPRAYDKFLEKFSCEEYAKLKRSRARTAGDPLADDNWTESSPQRLEVKEVVKQAKCKQLKREL